MGINPVDFVTAHVGPFGGHPLAVFDVLAERFERSDYRGCSSINTVAELPDPDDPAHRLAVALKDRMRVFFGELLAEHGFDDDGTLARRLLLLYDGASVTGVTVLDAAGEAPDDDDDDDDDDRTENDDRRVIIRGFDEPGA